MKRLFLILCIVGVLGCATAQPKTITDQSQQEIKFTDEDIQTGISLIFDIPLWLSIIH